ncbi:pantoate--beta-alanine ligase [Labrys sp. LIt4]|uniref:pantoate--beta-alanine ligase n=1 Tax=Labrys sp. LIt4 TaxID=2821355 RepID=UPI001AE07555|nr:pantoate--beta-alanine ligase [Labrys sp. LIt4]MBP0582922.1 pantoate--beta-alanine ligase [Labrys sp. LIt4]
MARQTLVVRTVAELRQAVKRFREVQETVALVPTMGALHDGHITLVRQARQRASRVVTTIFVNPTQFAPTEDLAKYPRTEAADLARLRDVGCDLLYAPDVSQVYPQGFATTVSLAGPAQAGLEDRFRPSHFAGVATVVTKLFCQSGADIALFGEKDYQQLCVVTQMARDLDLPITVVGVPTVREADGLAMSSRNRYLTPQQRAQAPLLHRTLRQVADDVIKGADIETALASGRGAIAAGGFELDYLEARQAVSLAPVTSLAEGPVRLLVAARLGATRLIDNIGVEATRR